MEISNGRILNFVIAILNINHVISVNFNNTVETSVHLTLSLRFFKFEGANLFGILFFQFQMILLFAIAMFFANTIFPAGL